MGRPTDWHVLDLDRDPTPGDPTQVQALARRLHTFAEDVGSALRQIRGMSGDSAVREWTGQAAEEYRSYFDGVPDKLDKLERSYRLCGDALAAYWPKLQQAQGDADRALEQGRQAKADLTRAQAQLTSAEDWVRRAGEQAERYQQDPAGNAPPPSEAEVRAATRNHQQAKAARERAQSAVNDAEARLEAAKRLAEQARQLRDDAADAAKRSIDEASDAGMQNKKWYEKVVDWVVDHWDDIVAVCKAVVAVLGIVVMIIGGPLAWVVLAAAVVVLADTILKFLQGKASLWDVGLAALDCIPGFKGLTTIGGLAALAKGGLKTLGRMRGQLDNLAGALRGGVNQMRQTARRLANRVTCGDPVDVVTGEVVLEQTDVHLSGVLPLVLRRTHVSSYRSGRLFGRSWASTLDQRLELDDEGVTFFAEDGTVLYYPVPRPGVPVMPLEGPRWPLTWDGTPGSEIRVAQPESRTTLHFAPGAPSRAGSPAPGGVLPLRAWTDRDGNRVDIRYGDDGLPTEVRHLGGYRVGVETADGRVTALFLAATGQPLLRYRYDQRGDLTELVNSSGAPLRLTYDEQGRLTGWEDRTGSRYRYTYDEQGRCVRTTGPDGFLSGTYDYDTDAHTTVATNSLGHATTYQYNASLQVVRETDPLGNTTHSSYDRYDRLVSRTDPLGRTTRWQYDEQGRLVGVVRADGATTHLAYDEQGHPTTVTHPDGSQEHYGYTSQGRLASHTDAAGATTEYGYDEHGRLAWVVDPGGGVRRIETNAAGLAVAVVDASGGVTRYHRDAFGRVVAVVDPVGRRTELAWTVEGKLARRVLPDGAVDQFRYDGEGGLVEHRDADGRVTRYERTHFGLLAAEIAPDGSRTTYHYDTELRVTGVTGPDGRTWRYTYDPAGRLVEENDVNGCVLRYRHDAAGQVVERTDGAGVTTRYRYDLLGNLLERRAEDTWATFQYDALGRLVGAVGPDARLAWQLDPVGRVLVESCNGADVTSRYDALGRRTLRRTPSGAVSDWQHDAEHRPVRLRTAGHALDFHRDAAGQEVERRLDGRVLLTRRWSPAGRLSEQWLATVAAGPARLHRRYRYSPAGHVIGYEDPMLGERELELSPTGRVTAVLGDGGATRQETYRYDALGNLRHGELPATVPSPPAVEPPRNLDYQGSLPGRSDRTHYEHDAQGRLVRCVVRLLSGGRREWRYSWDSQDRLTEVVTPDGTRWRYRYDPLGRRTAKERLAEDGTVAQRTDFVWDGGRLAEQWHRTREAPRPQVTTWEYTPEGHVPLVQCERTGPQVAAPGGAEQADGADTARSEPADDLAARVLNAPQEEIDARFYAVVTDLVGSPTELVAPDGTTAWQWRTTVWGLPLVASPGGATCPLRFPGQYADAETGLHYNRERYYEPATARYLSPDPLGRAPAPNPHGYVEDPFTWADPLGLAPCYVDLYHGTHSAAANNILRNGVNPTHVRRPTDFGQGGFYVTKDPGQAQRWASRMARRNGGDPVVLHFRVPVDELNKLSSRTFDGPSRELADFIAHNRNGGAMHDFELVEGPMLMNVRGFLRGDADPVFDGHQIAIWGDRAAELFTNSLVR